MIAADEDIVDGTETDISRSISNSKQSSLPTTTKAKAAQKQNDDTNPEDLERIDFENEDLSSSQENNFAWFEERISQVEHKFDYPDDSADDKPADTSVFDEEDEIVRQIYMNK
jgi:hypothetical protein